jgi:hypothetical protein
MNRESCSGPAQSLSEYWRAWCQHELAIVGASGSFSTPTRAFTRTSPYIKSHTPFLYPGRYCSGHPTLHSTGPISALSWSTNTSGIAQKTRPLRWISNSAHLSHRQSFLECVSPATHSHLRPDSRALKRCPSRTWPRVYGVSILVPSLWPLH